MTSGTARQRLPLPLCKNHYSAEEPLWAHCVTVVHGVMAVCLIADVVVLNVRIFRA
jgi:hypothetical protein